MLKNLSTKKALSLILCLMMVLSTVFTGFSVYAEDAATEDSTTEEVVAVDPTITDLSKTKDNDGNDIYNAYSSIDFDGLGENLIPDSTVADFNEDGTYKDYNAETKEGWWAKDSTIGGTMNLKTKELLTNDTTQSHTADGSGAILANPTQYSFTKLPLPAMEAEKYYVITLWMHRTDTSNQGNSSKIVYYGTKADGADGEFIIQNNAWMNGTAGKWVRFSFVLYTGTAAQNSSNLSIYQTFAAFDELAVYEVSTEYAEKCITDGALFNLKDLRDATAIFKNVTTTGSSTNYKDIDFTAFGENLITDPNVSYFDEDGNYKKYYAYDIEEGEYILSGSYPAVVDTNAFWNKVADKYQAFPGGAAGTYGSPDDLGYVDATASRTDDGSGMLKISGKQSIYLPMPALKYKEYYVVSFWIKSDAAQSVSTRFHTSLWSGTSSQMGVSTTTDWQRATFIWYTGQTADLNGTLFDFYHSDGSNTIYVDDFEVYKLDAAYGARCVEAGYLISKKDDLPAEGKYAQIYFNAANGNSIYDYSEIDFSQYGENLVPDSTVADFEADGVTYKAYNSETKEGWWAKPALSGQSGANNMWAGMKERGFISNDTTLSHTNDGSGVIALPASQNITLPLPKFEKKSYYLVTYWVKFAGKGANIRYFPETSGIELGNYSYFNSTDWQRVTIIVYTGSTANSQPKIGFWTNYAGYIDDIAMYELDYEYGETCYELGRLKTEKDDRPDDFALNIVDANNYGVYYPSLGENLMTDGNVAYFDEAGNYKPYYVDENTNTDAAKAVADANAWWAKAGNTYQWFSEYIGNGNTGRKVYGSMKARGLIDNEFSRSVDGSGSLLVPNEAYLPMPKLASNNDYYTLTFWAYAESQMTLITKFMNSNLSALTENAFTLNAGWNRVTQVVYVGDAAFTPTLYVYTNNNDVYLDEFGLYKLDYEYGLQAVTEGKLPKNRETVKGDINCDDVVNLKDIVRLKKYSAGMTSDVFMANADVEGDGKIDSADIAKFTQYLTGGITF